VVFALAIVITERLTDPPQAGIARLQVG